MSAAPPSRFAFEEGQAFLGSRPYAVATVRQEKLSQLGRAAATLVKKQERSAFQAVVAASTNRRNMGEMVCVRTVTLLLALIWGMSFAFGVYQIYSSWAEHEGAHGHDGTEPLGLPKVPADDLPRRQHMRLGT